MLVLGTALVMDVILGTALVTDDAFAPQPSEFLGTAEYMYDAAC